MKKNSFAIATKGVKYLRINLKDVKDLCTEIYIVKRDWRRHEEISTVYSWIVIT